MTNTPYASGLPDPDRGDQGEFAQDQPSNYDQPLSTGSGYVPPAEPVYSLPPDQSPYGGPASADPWATAPAGQSGRESTAGVAKEEAANVAGTTVQEGKAVAGTAVEAGKDVAGTAVEAGKNVAATAKTEAANVASEVGQQAKSLLSTAASELKSQAGTQQGRLASTLRTYTDELRGLAQGSSPEPGPLTDLAHQAADKGSEIVQWLEDREPADVLADVRRFAQRRPVMFLALCGLGGVVAGRITRGAVAANTSVDSPKPAPSLEGQSSFSATPGYTPGPAYAAVADYPTSPGYAAAPGYPTTPGYASTTGEYGTSVTGDYTGVTSTPGYPETGGPAR